MRGWRRVVFVSGWTVAALLLTAIIAVLVLTGTDWGRERVRRYAEAQLNRAAHGEVRIGRISGNLLRGMTVHGFVIRDTAGLPFVAIERASGRYDVFALLRRRIWIDDLELERALVVLDRPPDQDWNWQRIFPPDPLRPPRVGPGWGDWIRFTHVHLIDGHLIIRNPWRPDPDLSPAARDSVVRHRLAGGGREMIVPVAGGFQRVMEFQSITGRLPVVRISDPDFDTRLVQVTTLAMQAYPFRPPGADIRDLAGSFHFDGDSLWWNGADARLPGTRLVGHGRYSFATGDMSLLLRGDPVTLADMRWLYPRLPADARGRTDLRLVWQGGVQDYFAYNMELAVDGGRISGTFGLILEEVPRLYRTDVRLANIDTRLLEQVIPDFEAPRRGAIDGRARVSGTRYALAVDADLTYRTQVAGTSRIIATGEIGFPARGLRARNLAVRLQPLQVDLVRAYRPDLPLGGTLTGRATLNGTTTERLAAHVDLVHLDRGERSHVIGDGRFQLARELVMDIDVRVQPLSLVTVGRFAPEAGLQGSVAGTIRLTGPPSDLAFATDLGLPDGGRFTGEGQVALAGDRTRYDARATLRGVNLGAVFTWGPSTRLNARAEARGAGFDPATMTTTLAADVGPSAWQDVAVDSGVVRLAVSDGLARVNRLDLHAAHAAAEAWGTFGLARHRTGDLMYRIAVDSLHTLDRAIPAVGTATGRVHPRPRTVTRARDAARPEAERIERERDVQRALAGLQPRRDRQRQVEAGVPAPDGIPRDTAGGSFYAAGTLRGNLYDFDLRGRAAGQDVALRGHFVRSFRSEYGWTNARTPRSLAAVALVADTIRIGGFAFDQLDGRLSYRSPEGTITVAVRQDDDTDYDLRGEFVLREAANELRITDLALRFDTTAWRAQRPALVRWGRAGVEIVDLDLQDARGGRIHATGLLPTEGSANLEVSVRDFPVEFLAGVLQTDVDAKGLLTLAGRFQGTTRAPTFTVAFGVADGVYQGTDVPLLRGQATYAGMQLVSRIQALREADGAELALVDAQLPINLAMTGVVGSRLLDGPARVDVAADSLPLDLLPAVTTAVSDAEGYAAGQLALRGTLQEPVLAGSFVIADGDVRVTPLGTRVNDIHAIIRLANDTVYVDSIAGTSRGPVFLRGTIAVSDWRDPVFNMFLVSNNARIIDNDQAQLRADAGLALTGPLSSPYLSGQVNILSGVIFLPEPGERDVLGAGDPELFRVLDTAVVRDEGLFPERPAFMRNLRVEVAIGVERGTWVRNRDANVEIFTDFPVFVRYIDEDLALTGAVSTDRGEYRFLSRRFQIRRGSAIFVGAPEINPTLQAIGEYEVQVPGSPVLNVRVVIGGTMRRPRLSLESDAQPPRSQAELLSLMAFGRTTGSLTTFAGSGVGGSPGGGDLFGFGANLAVRRLAGVALGVMTEELEEDVRRGLGADYVNITPADVPQEFLQAQRWPAVITHTRVEVGRYIGPDTFLGVQQAAGVFGFRVQHRTGGGWLYEALTEQGVMPAPPTLAGQRFNAVRRNGVFVIREWRF